MRNNFLSFLIFVVLLLTGAFSIYAADDITGVWIMLDDKTNKPGAYVLLYMYNEKLYGRMLALIEFDTGLIEDTISLQRERSQGIAGNPPICGMDFIYELENRDREWRGSMIDPDRGRLYNCTIKRNGNNLTMRVSLRGILGLLGVNQTWIPAPSEIPPEIVVPDVSTIVPLIPRR